MDFAANSCQNFDAFADNNILMSSGRSSDLTYEGFLNEYVAPRASSRCPVCGENATGKHYGIQCCDGCKSFFRRSIRGKQKYNCDYGGRCETRKNGKSRCRACRFNKCLSVGMNSKSVQQERDRIRPRSKNKTTVPSSGTATIHEALDFRKFFPEASNSLSNRHFASLFDLDFHLSQQIPRAANWARNIPGFSQLSSTDQTLLLQNHAAPHLLFEVAVRSLDTLPHLLVGTEHCIGTEASAPTFHLGGRILNELVKPLHSLKLDAAEFASIKVILLYESCLPYLTDKERVSELQAEIFVALELHVSNKLCRAGDRFREICILIDTFPQVATDLIATVEKWTSMGGTSSQY